MALQRQLSFVASEKDDDVAMESDRSAATGDGHRVRSRTITSLSSVKSVNDGVSAAEKKPLVSNQLIKEEDVEEGAVRSLFHVVSVQSLNSSGVICLFVLRSAISTAEGQTLCVCFVCFYVYCS